MTAEVNSPAVGVPLHGPVGPAAWAVMAFGRVQQLVVRADVADELACKWRERDQEATAAPLYASADGEMAQLRAALARALFMLRELEFSVDTGARTGKDTMGCPLCEGGAIVGLPGQHRDDCELAGLLRELAP